jgi:hypothetical protein
MDHKLCNSFNKLSINDNYPKYICQSKIPAGYPKKEYNNSCYNCSDVENIWKPIKKINNSK